MGRARELADVGRSLATGVLRGRGGAGRLRTLVAPEPAGAATDPARAAALDALATGAGVTELQRAMAAGELTSEELTAHLLARAVRLDPGLACLIELNPAALDEARAADARRARGEALPLLGIPVTVKDNIATAGPMRTTAGAAILADHVAGADAAVVAALRAAGAVVLAKANLSELAGAVVPTPGFSAVGGQTANPYGAGHTPGGSSSGSAVSVAAGLAPLSVGTETSGSLLAPAAFNGVVGMKPSRGLIDGTGIIPLVRHQDSAGPIARTVADAALLLAALAGGRLEPDLAAASLAGVRVGVLGEAILAQQTPFEDTTDNPAMLERIEAGLRAAGAVVVPATMAPGAAGFESRLLTVVFGGLTHDTMGALAALDLGVTTLADLQAHNLREPRTRMPKGQALLSAAVARRVSWDAYETAAMEQRAAAERMLEATFAAADVEVLASMSNLHASWYATAGWPAVSIPLGLRAGGMPAGVTLIARPGRDPDLLGWAHAFEQASALRSPPVLA
jgi:amidase